MKTIAIGEALHIEHMYPTHLEFRSMPCGAHHRSQTRKLYLADKRRSEQPTESTMCSR